MKMPPQAMHSGLETPSPSSLIALKLAYKPSSFSSVMSELSKTGIPLEILSAVKPEALSRRQSPLAAAMIALYSSMTAGNVASSYHLA